jgi:peptidyl-prolyl cis-trans isomerase A (cyclophilin A)
MTRCLLIAATAALALAAPLSTAPAAAQPQAAPAAAPADSPFRPLPEEQAFETETVRIDTEAGPIILEIETERAPVTAANFLRYVKEGRLENAAFYRASQKLGEGRGFIQFGLRQHPDFVFPPIAHEPTSETGLTHKDGTISMVRGEPGTADADFLIMVSDQPQWDAKGDNPGYAAFGRVVQGMETVKSILAAPTDPNKGDGVLKGELLAEDIPVTGASVVEE